jgi:hypothetical protein
MSQNKLIILLVLSTIAYACSEDEASINLDLDKKYKINRTEISPVRVFTKNGEITDKASIEKALLRLDEINNMDLLYFNGFELLSGDEEINNIHGDYIEFDGTLAWTNSSDRYTYAVSGDFLRLTELDTSYAFRSISSTPSPLNSIPLHHWLYEESEGTITKNWTIGERIKYLDERYARIRPGEIWFPMIRAFHYYNRDTNFLTPISIAMLHIHNELNEKAYQDLAASDTLLVQQYWIIYN